MSESQAGIVFSLEKVYVKDLSFEAPNTPQVFLEKQAPEVGVQLGIEHNVVDAQQGVYEVLLAVTATAKLGETTVFLAEAKQAGVFRIGGVAAGEMQKVLEISCPNILLPFVREVVNDLVTKGGFPQLLLTPVNFEALYRQKAANNAQRA